MATDVTQWSVDALDALISSRVVWIVAMLLFVVVASLVARRRNRS